MNDELFETNVRFDSKNKLRGCLCMCLCMWVLVHYLLLFLQQNLIGYQNFSSKFRNKIFDKLHTLNVTLTHIEM